ncbi:MAG: AAA family ATPase [Bacillota bacterium]
MFTSAELVQQKLAGVNYLVTKEAATVVYIAGLLGKPLLVEGPAGVGKTELGKSLALARNEPLIRLQCYEGLDESKALYEWNYHMQLLCMQAKHTGNRPWREIRENVYSEEFLLPRPLLQALLSEKPVILLIDELDKSDEEFESFLLEALSDYQVSIPELGTVKAKNHPVVVITSNSVRELSDALRRRCIYLYIDYPDAEKELDILRLRLPGLEERLSRAVVRFIQRVRKQELKKLPSIAESLEWAQTLMLLGIQELTPEAVPETLPVLLKHREDVQKLMPKLAYLLSQ